MTEGAGMSQYNERIRVENVGKVFDTVNGSIQVAEDVSFGVGDGEFVSLVGP